LYLFFLLFTSFSPSLHDVVLRIAGANDAGHHQPDVHAHPEGEVVVRVLVDAEQLLLLDENESYQGGHSGQLEGGRHVGVRLYLVDPHVRHQTDGGHLSRADRFDLVNRAKSLLAQQLVKVGDDLVQEPQALDVLVVAVQLDVEL